VIASPKSVVNLLLKYADDTNLLVPENTDVELADEFRHVCSKFWTLFVPHPQAWTTSLLGS